MPAAQSQIPALTCHIRDLLGVGIVLVAGGFRVVLGAEGLGDALVGGGGLAVDAVGVDL